MRRLSLFGVSTKDLVFKMSFHQISQRLNYFTPIACLSLSLAIALPAIAQANQKQPSQVVTQNKILYVNSQTGSDRPEFGSSNQQAFKTITYAISRAKVGQPTIIQLAEGKYSIATGEKFPIRLRPNLTLRGNETNKGKDIVISGGGILLSKSRFSQNVAIAFSDSSELRGVTVTNPNPRGYGLWIENASPAISNNTLLDNQQDGGLITGKSTAIVSANQFFRNGTSGLAIEGDASPNVRSNLFQQTTFGMSIRQDATPQIIENTFTQNQNGILIQASAKPFLRGNAIVNNRSYGLTISDLAQPDLGKANDDGNNTFQGNGIFDLQNVSRNAVVVSGNQLDSKRVKGDLQLLNVRPLSNLFANNSSLSPSQPMNLAPNLDSPPALVKTVTNSNSIGNSFIPNNQGNQANNPFWYEPVTSVIIRITPKNANSPIPVNSEISTRLPPVRSFPPSGEPVNQPIQIAPLSNTSLTPQNPARYRVVVPVSSESGVAQVRQIAPNSFPSRLNGYLVVQIGAYSDRRIAEAQVTRLTQQGLPARIESIAGSK